MMSLAVKLMDFHGNGVHHVGFRNPHVMQAVKDQLDRMPFCTRRYTNQRAVDLARKMREITPGDLDKVLFAPGGTSAIGMAMKLARLATGRYKTISMWGSFHGASIDVISVGGQSLFSDGLGPLTAGSDSRASADCRRLPLRMPMACVMPACAEYIRHIMENEPGVAAVIAEPIRWSTVTDSTGAVLATDSRNLRSIWRSLDLRRNRDGTGAYGTDVRIRAL